jgi:hypothetical protein
MAGRTYRWTEERRTEVESALRSSRTRAEAAKKLGGGLGALDSACRAYGFEPNAMLGTGTGKEESPDAQIRRQLQEARSELKKLREDGLTDDLVRREIIGLRDAPTKPPEWLIETHKTKRGPGVPSLFASDWHWFEVVDPQQIGGANEYDREIGHRRARAFVENAVDVLKHHMVCPEYPGIVLPLGGDMVSGDIHEELSVTNEAPIMAAVLDLFGVLTWVVSTLADEFGNVFVPAVTGNHGRNTLKIRAKGRAHTSFDWLLYQFLAKRFENDKRIAFQIPLGPDALYQVYGHRYLLTHGDQFRGGDGMIGALGPIIRGDHKKRSRNGQIDQSYDTLLCGHWHQLIQLQRLIVNGSLKGYDEYASSNNFPFESPRQALWITHPAHGITFSMPVLVEKLKARRASSEWVSWSEARAA